MAASIAHGATCGPVVLDPCSLLPLKSKRKQSHDTQRLYFISTELYLFSEEVMSMETEFKHGNFYFCKQEVFLFQK